MSRTQRQLINQAKTGMYHAWGAWSQTFGQNYDYILMLASARSGSTLLAHILTSNPEIFGMGESKLVFSGQQDYRQLTGKNLYFHRRSQLPRSGHERYILDKMVHNYLLDPQDAALLNDPRVRVIFLLRDPGPTLTSFMRALNVDEDAALDYFVTRMDYLGQYAQNLSADKEAVYLTYEELLSCTQPIFDLLQTYLDLQQPLSEQYDVTNTTGVFSLGDKSENIKSGRIITPTSMPTSQLSPETLAGAQEAYNRCASILQERCRHVTPQACSAANSSANE